MVRKLWLPMLLALVFVGGVFLGKAYSSPLGTYCNTGALMNCPSGVRCDHGPLSTCSTTVDSSSCATCFNTLLPYLCQDNFACTGQDVLDDSYCTCDPPYPNC